MSIIIKSRAFHIVLLYACASALCLLAPFVVFLTANKYPVFAVEVLPLHLAGPVVGVVIATLLRLQLHAFARFALWVCLFIAMAFLYDLDSLPQVIAVAVGSGVAVWMLKDNAATVLLIVAAIHIITTLSLVLLDRPNVSPRVSQSQSAAMNGSVDLPPVLHLVLDEFAGLRGFPRELPGSQALVSKLANYYPARGFDLYSHAYSQYSYTTNSLANLVNFTSSASNGVHVSGTEGAFVLSDNKYFEHLSDLGYDLHIYQSSFLNFCATPGVPVTSCSTYQSNSIAAIADVDMPTAQKTRFILNSFLDSSAFLRKIRQAYLLVGDRLDIKLPSWPTGNSRTGPLAVMPTLVDLEAALRELRPGEVHFAHLMLPHYPYSLDAGCAVKPNVHGWLNSAPFDVRGPKGEQNNAASRAERYGQYLAQVECTQAIIERLFAAIKASGEWQQAIIVIHGDHGSRIVRWRLLEQNRGVLVEDDFRDAYSAFFAVKDGTSIGKLDTSPWTLQTLLARAWQLPAPQLDPKQIYLRAGSANLLAASLLGFTPIPGISNTVEKK